MNTLIYISAFMLLLGWAVLLVIGLTYDFDYDEKDKRHVKSFPKANPNNRSESTILN